jgi:hypothetical protein
MTYIVKKPQGTFYSDFTFSKGYLYAIFEHDQRVSNIKVCKTDITNETWIQRTGGKITGFAGEVKETETDLIITLNK